MSLVGLTKAANFLQDRDDYGEEMVRAWPGVLKWSLFFFAGRVQGKNINPEAQKSNLDVITVTWYSMSRSDSSRKVMSATKGSIEIATQMWILEDKHDVPSMIDIPSASAALDVLLRDERGLATGLLRPPEEMPIILFNWPCRVFELLPIVHA
jgi:hypothetical protein